MKNIFMFVIDSLNYTRIKEAPHLMPFLSELEATGVSCSHMYSQAPYTEAAVMSLYCGQNVLDHGGYINRFKDAPYTVFEVLREKGYTTYYNSFQPQCYPSSLRRGVSDLFYNVGFDLGALWSYRLSHYSQLCKSGKLNPSDYETIRKILEDNFQEWLLFERNLIEGNDEVAMISGNASGYDAELVLELVSEEYSKFSRGYLGYIKALLNEGTEHNLFKIPAYIQNKKIKNPEIIAQINNLYKPLFKKIKRRGTALNLRNGGNFAKGPMGKAASFFAKPSKNSLKDVAKSLYLSADHLFDVDLNQRIGSHPDWFKNAPSARTHIEHFVGWVESRGSDEAPFFACVHVDDVHNPEVFFTYDTSDLEILTKELRDAEEVLDTLPADFSGSITHDLSLRYIDGVIRYLYECLEERSLIDDTYVLICADHGFSFSGRPLRDSFVNNFYLENYNIPFVLTGPGVERARIEDLRTSKDIPATICYLAECDMPDSFTGKEIQGFAGNSVLTIEYCGGGCPDLSRRDLKIAAFDDSFFVGTLCKVEDDASYANVTEIYDLQRDPRQLNNLAEKEWNTNEVDSFLTVINERLKKIRSSLE